MEKSRDVRVHFLCSSRYMPELNFGFYHKAAEVYISSHATGFLSQCQSFPWYRDNWFGITLAVLSEESLAQASVQAASQPSSGWMTKPVKDRHTHAVCSDIYPDQYTSTVDSKQLIHW